MTETVTFSDHLFTLSPHPMWVYDLDTLEFLQVNQAALTCYGYTRDEFLSLRITDIEQDASAPKRPAPGQRQHRLKNSRVINVEIAEHPIEFLGRRAALVAAQDVTARQQAEQALEQRTRDQMQLYRVSQTLAATLDLHQVTRRLLQAVTDMMGTQGGSVWLWDKERPGELVCQAAFHPNLEHLLVGLRLRAEQGLVGWVAHHGKSALVLNAASDPRFYPGVDAQTGFQTISLLAVPLRVRDTVIGVLEVVNKQQGEFDDHDLALIETLAGPASIAIDNALLVEALRHFASTLQARNDDLDAFAHTVAHDLKHPLTLIIGFADALLHDHAAMSPEQLERSLQNILQSGNKMNNIIDELMLLGEVRKTGKRSVPLDMAGIVAQAQQRLADMIEQHHAEIMAPDALAWPQAFGYAPWVEEVWVNYLSNAIKYGGRPLRIELGADLQTEPRTSQPMIRFWVRDNGNGLAPGDQARLFTAFTQLDQVHAQGHGLGLSIVQRIVEKLGGQVGVESQGVPGHGSTFFFTLPSAVNTPTSGP